MISCSDLLAENCFLISLLGGDNDEKTFKKVYLLSSSNSLGDESCANQLCNRDLVALSQKGIQEHQNLLNICSSLSFDQDELMRLFFCIYR